MSRRRITVLAVMLAVIAGLLYFEGPSMIASQNNEALRICSDQRAPTAQNTGIEWRAGFPSGWWCRAEGVPADTYLFWWN